VQAAPERSRPRRGRRPQPEAERVAEIKVLIAGQPTHGYWSIRRAWCSVFRERITGLIKYQVAESETTSAGLGSD
jgi:hypothetical protein